MILAKHNSIKLIGYSNSTITQESLYFIKKEFTGSVDVISPKEFLESGGQDNCTYGVAFTLDQDLRLTIIKQLQDQNLDCLIYIHNSVVCHFDLVESEIKKYVGAGSFIAPHSSMLWGSTLGNHCVIETYCLISHHVSIGNNVQLHSGTMIAGRTSISSNCVLNFKSSVLNGLCVCSDVELGAMSCITKNISVPGKYVGSPARRIGNREMFEKADQ